MNGATPSAIELLDVLESEERLYQELRGVLQEERERIVNLDAGGLEEVVQRKEALAAEGKLLEEGRIEAARRLAIGLGLPAERPTLSTLCDALGEGAKELREAHSRMVALVGAVRELLDANAGFAGESLGQVRGTLTLLGRLLPVNASYGPVVAAAPPGPSSGSLVRRSA